MKGSHPLPYDVCLFFVRDLSKYRSSVDTSFGKRKVRATRSATDSSVWLKESDPESSGNDDIVEEIKCIYLYAKTGGESGGNAKILEHCRYQSRKVQYSYDK